MKNMQQILKSEKYNDDQIFLYKMDECWYAYERSAFYIFSICSVDNIFKVKNVNDMFIAVSLKGINIRIKNPHFTILEESDNQIILRCSTTCKGFLYWRDRFLPFYKSIEKNEYTNSNYEN